MHTDGSQIGDTPMICDLLQRWNASGKLPARRLARIWHLADHSIYKYLTDREPTWGKIQALFDAVEFELQQELLQLLITGHGWMCTHIDADLDVDGDGDVDTDDAVASVIGKTEAYARMLNELYAAAGKRRVCDTEFDTIHAAGHEVMRGVITSLRIVAQVNRKHQGRKIATVIGGER